MTRTILIVSGALATALAITLATAFARPALAQVTTGGAGNTGVTAPPGTGSGRVGAGVPGSGESAGSIGATTGATAAPPSSPVPGTTPRTTIGGTPTGGPPGTGGAAGGPAPSGP